MKEDDIEIIEDGISALAKRGDDLGIPFQPPWAACHVQNCRLQLARDRNNKQLYRCVPVENGCENLGEVWCCCEMFRFKRSLPKDERQWEHVPDGRNYKEYDEEWKYQCFCVYTMPWDEDLMNCK